MFFHVGDAVTIRPDLEYDQRYEMADTHVGDIVNESMLKFVGQEARIAEATTYGAHKYRIDLDDGRWCWTDEMFVEYCEINGIPVALNELVLAPEEELLEFFT